MKRFMILAIEEAKKSTQPVKCGAVIVREGIVIAKACNAQRASKNAAAHAEMVAIADAGKRLGDKKLSGCEIYCTHEPCIMCLSAMSFAEITKLIFGIPLRNAWDADNIIDIDIGTFIDKSPHRFEIAKEFMTAECKSALRNA